MRNISAALISLILAIVLVPTLGEANSGDFSGGVAIGASYAGVDTAPSNGLLVQGNVGVGTTSPNYELDIQSSTTGSQLHISGTGTDSGLYLENFGANISNIYSGSSFNGTNFIAKATTANAFQMNAGYLNFYATTGLTVGNSFTQAQVASISPAGGLSIGTSFSGITAPTGGAIIQGDVGIGISTPSYLLQVGSSSASGIVMELQNSSGACTHNPGASSETVSCSSDESLKADIEDTTGGLAWLDDMHVRDFTVKATGERKTGVIAQELMQTHPAMVHENEEGLYSVEQPNPWVLVKAVQDLHSLVSAQQVEIDGLKQAIVQLHQQQPRAQDAK